MKLEWKKSATIINVEMERKKSTVKMERIPVLLKKSANKIRQQLEHIFFSLKWSAKIVLKKERIITSLTILLIIHRRTVPLIIIWLTERISSTPYGFQGVRQ